MDKFDGIDLGCYSDKAAVRRALVSEIAADDVYGDVVTLTKNPAVASVFKELRKDEQNHQGKLLALLVVLEGEGSEFIKNFNAGLNGEEATAASPED